jgi:nitrogen fixation protein
MTKMRVLIACEFSGIVREAFKDKGHDAWSCDLLPTEIPGQHIQGDVLSILNDGWDLMIAHPPCTYLCVSGIRWNTNNPIRKIKTDQAIDFFNKLFKSKIPKKALENPISVISSKIRKPDQIIRPNQFGHGSTKATCLWLFNLPKLVSTNMVPQETYTSRSGRVWDKWFFESSLISNLEDRSKFRSKTFPGIAAAMADQWG